jgi:outer membrane murein-binding lipoprotein Lpp
MRGIYGGLLLALCLPCTAADDFKVIELEQDVIELERRVEELSRQVAQLQQRTAAAATRPPTPGPAPAGSAPWLSAANWGRVRAGMSEFEVIDILGPPSSVRGAPESESRTLMYAMEIGSSAFLSGRVDLKDRRVVEVQVPALR